MFQAKKTWFSLKLATTVFDVLPRYLNEAILEKKVPLQHCRMSVEINLKRQNKKSCTDF